MKLILATVISFVVGAVCAGELSTNGCRVAWTDTSLTVENSRFTRRYVATADGLKTVSFKATGGGEFVREKAKGGAPLSVSCSVERPSPVSEECVNVRVAAGGVTNVPARQVPPRLRRVHAELARASVRRGQTPFA